MSLILQFWKKRSKTRESALERFTLIFSPEKEGNGTSVLATTGVFAVEA
jgi:hypothetical protein